jgi:hypothetical protein
LVHSAQESGAQVEDLVTGRETPPSQRINEDHELACSRNKNQRPVGGDRKLEQENQTRQTDVWKKNRGKDSCARGKKEIKHSTS